MKLWQTLLLWLAIFVGYSLVGGAVFVALEGPAQTAQLEAVAEARDNVTTALYAHFAAAAAANNSNSSSSSGSSSADDDDDDDDLRQAAEDLLADACRLASLGADRQDWTSYGDSVYFVVVALTTLGLGDLAPRTEAGRAAFILYAGAGLFITFYLISVLSEMLLGRAALVLELRDRHQGNGKKSEKEKNKRCWRSAGSCGCCGGAFRRFWNRHIVLAAAVFLFIVTMVLSAAVFYGVEDWTYIDALYFSFTTISTIGFGDLYPGTPAGKAFLVVYILIGVAFYSFLITKGARNFAVNIQRRVAERSGTVSLDVLEDVREMLPRMTAHQRRELARHLTEIEQEIEEREESEASAGKNSSSSSDSDSA